VTLAATLSTLRDRPTTRIGLIGLSVVGYVLCIKLLLEHGVAADGGLGALDVTAYWTAARHIRDGAPIYGPGVGGYTAFLYPPVLAQAFVPLSFLPATAAAWLWRLVEVACLRVTVGSWRNVGLALLLWPPIILELDAGNVHLVIAASVALAMRGDARAVAPAALTKFASIAAVPLGWVADRRGFLLGIGVAAAIVLVSVALGPDLWRAYATFLPSVPPTDAGWYDLGRGVPLVVRLAGAAAVAIAAVRWRRLAPVAATLALPVLWLHSLSVLVAVATPIDRRQAR
jgi:hypothetical protein